MGMFRNWFGPSREEIWRQEQFTVVQMGETPTDEKESTVSAFMGGPVGVPGVAVDRRSAR